MSQLTLFFKIPGYFWPGFLGMEADGHSRTTDVFSDVKLGLKWESDKNATHVVWTPALRGGAGKGGCHGVSGPGCMKVLLTLGLSAWPFSNTKDVMLELQYLGSKENERQCLKGWPIQTWELCFWSRAWLHLWSLVFPVPWAHGSREVRLLLGMLNNCHSSAASPKNPSPKACTGFLPQACNNTAVQSRTWLGSGKTVSAVYNCLWFLYKTIYIFMHTS